MFEKNIILGDKNFTFCSKSEPKVFEFEQIHTEGQLSEYELTVDMGCKENQSLSVKWSNHMVGLLSYWSPTAKRDRDVKQWYNANTNMSNLYYGAPLISVINQGNENFSTVAVSEAVRPVRMTFSVNDFEEKENVDFHIYLFEEGWTMETHTIRIRIDERKIPYYEAIASVSNWWQSFYPTNRKTTDNGELPLYSTWYNFHQNPTQEVLEEELEEAAKCGFGSLIIDDGWSYDGSGKGDYRDCGNWQIAESKFPDFKGFIGKIHEYGIKAALWFPVPFVGYQTEDYQRFQGKILYNSDKDQAGILDPRYPEVRKYITDNYTKIVNAYDLDGLKLDFIDSFRCADKTLLIRDKSPDYDCEEVEEGVSRLLQEIREALVSQKQDFMIEFRQFYVGPAMTRECNMLRVIDCPFDYITNRVGIVDLRLMNYDLAVHADMLIWAKDEQLEIAAKMLLNIMFGVPQISVLFKNSTSEQKKMIKHYINYWYENRKIILHGEFKAYDPELYYSLVSSENKEKKIAVVYAEKAVCFEGKTTDVFNATAYDYLYIENMFDKSVKAITCDCCGNRMQELLLEKGIHKVKVLQGGKITIMA